MVDMDNKGQISVEVILFVAIVLFIVLAVGYYISDQSEQNNIATATRLGAENATTSMGITNPGMMPVRVDAVQMNGDQNITLIINLSYSSTQIKNTTLNGVYIALTSQGYSPQKGIGLNNYIQNLTMNTSRHNYTIQVA
ncbi:class III signal peptide-containing protein [Methanobacterium subterraneum]|uniref:Class III signal peptide-containing protein n=1 Tax=Methanobacterium subterraneum TaxID=59277 RepID=A0A2H4VND3_9EURY|nr:class III signal peptide-containing protein [Methanobacterium subterraneum]AUB59613.1 class III signal peptide-containing protein [Methanobacterium subterraneum]